MSTFEIACVSILTVVFSISALFDIKADKEKFKYYENLNNKKE